MKKYKVTWFNCEGKMVLGWFYGKLADFFEWSEIKLRKLFLKR